MPDICMCDGTFIDGTKCPKRHECYRHEAEPHPKYQSWFYPAPPLAADGSCDYFIPVDPSAEFKPKDAI